MTYSLSAEAEAREEVWTAMFSNGASQVESVAFAVGDGRHLITVAVSGSDAERGILKLAGRELPADIFVDPVSRLVVFRILGPPGKALPMLAPSAADVPVLFTGGAGKVSGVVKQIDGKILPLRLLKVDYDVEAPPPGSPLTNSSGSLVGVAHQTTGPKDGYAVPVEVVKRVLEDVQTGGRIARAWIGLKLQPSAAAPQVTGIQSDSPSARSGILPGDVLLTVGSRHVEDYADAVNAFYFLRPGIATSLRVRRGTQELTVSVMPVERGVD